LKSSKNVPGISSRILVAGRRAGSRRPPDL
jgi:hypothetical protein